MTSKKGFKHSNILEKSQNINNFPLKSEEGAFIEKSPKVINNSMLSFPNSCKNQCKCTNTSALQE